MLTLQIRELKLGWCTSFAPSEKSRSASMASTYSYVENLSGPINSGTTTTSTCSAARPVGVRTVHPRELPGHVRRRRPDRGGGGPRGFGRREDFSRSLGRRRGRGGERIGDEGRRRDQVSASPRPQVADLRRRRRRALGRSQSRK